MNLGLEPHYGGYFDGSLDEFRFYDRPLYASEKARSIPSNPQIVILKDWSLTTDLRVITAILPSTAIRLLRQGHYPGLKTGTIGLHGRLILMGVMPSLAILRSSRIFQAITVAGWVKLDAHTNQWQLIATKWKDNAHSWHLAINTNNKLDATYSTNGTDVSAIMETETFPVGEWQHVAMSIDVAKNSVKLFRNGFLVSSGSFGGTTIPVTESPVHYGARGERQLDLQRGN